MEASEGLTLVQHLKRIEAVLTHHMLFPTVGPVQKDRDAHTSLVAIARACGVEIEPLEETPMSNAERIRQAAQSYKERKRR